MRSTEEERTISVILPVYNVGPWIRECIDSLKRQDMEGLEFIFVDDCGSDDSMRAVEEWEEEDPRVTILWNKENMGAGPSRNKGIAAAGGRYMTFVDPDDYISDDYLATLFRLAEEGDLDMVKGGRSMKDIDGRIVKPRRDLNTEIKKGLKEGRPLYCLFTYEHHGTLFRSSFIKDNGISYGTSVRAQDDTFLLRACSRTDRFGITDDSTYFFCERKGSAMHLEDATHLNGMLDSVSERVEEVMLHLKDDPYAENYLAGMFKEALVESERYSHIEDMEPAVKEYLEDLRKEIHRTDFFDSMAKKSFAIYMLSEEGTGLPPRPYKLPWDFLAPPEAYIRLIKEWKKALKVYPEEGSRGMREYLSIVKQAAESASYYGNGGQGARIIFDGLTGFPLRLYKYILLVIAKRGTNRIRSVYGNFGNKS